MRKNINSLTFVAAVLFLAGVIFSAGCKEEVKKQLYFKDLIPPIGVGNIKVISDVSMNPIEGGEITIITMVPPDIDRDELDRLMSAFYRQAKERTGFRTNNMISKIDLRFYTSEEQAKAGGGNWLGEVIQTSSTAEPKYTNKQKAPLLKWVMKALGPQPEFAGKLKPQILVDVNAMTVELNVPFVKIDGTGEYVDKMTFERATSEFTSYLMTLFPKIEGLTKITFSGKHNDEVVIKISITREQYEQLNLQQVEEQLGAFQGSFLPDIIGKAITEKQVEKKVIEQRRKVYRETLAKLPSEQVMLSSKLK